MTLLSEEGNFLLIKLLILVLLNQVQMVAEFKLLDNFFELMMDNPSPQQVLDFKASPEEEAWIANLIVRSKEGRITTAEQADIDYFLKIESAITLAKTKAFVKLKGQRA